jgi:hypothetical protein
MKKISTMAAAIALAACASMAHAGAITVVTPGNGFTSDAFTLGFEFSVAADTSLTALGVYDAGLDGLESNAMVGLWNTSGDLLASTVVGAGTAGTLDNYFRYAAITPFALTAGVHYIVGSYLAGGLASSYNTNQGGSGSVDPLVTIHADRYSAFDSAFGNPTSSDGLAGAWLGANFQYGDGGMVPEPGAWALMILGFGMAGAVLRRRAPLHV